MKRKFRRRQNRYPNSSRSHYRTLGFESQKEYQDWCILNGFSDFENKDEEDRQFELMASLSTGPGWRDFAQKQLARRPLHEYGNSEEFEVVQQILSGDIQSKAAVDNKYASLCAGVDRLRGPDVNANLEAYRRLIHLLHNRGQSLYRFGRPIRRAAAGSCTFGEALASVAGQHRRWIRPLETWECSNTTKHRDVFRSLVFHLFVRHSIPDCLLGCWYHSDRKIADKEIRVFVHVSHGHSIRTAGLQMPYSKRMSHHFHRAPHALSLNQALWWGHVRGKGGDTTLAKAFAGSNVGQEIANVEFWGQVVDWFIAHPQVDGSSVGPILDYLNNQKFGVGNPQEYADATDGQRIRRTMPPAQPRLCMLGRTPSALLRELERWHRSFEFLTTSDFVWQRSKIPSFQTTSKGGSLWSIEELLSSAALYREGKSQNHCVGSYAHMCAEGKTTIWSLKRTRDGKSKQCLTVQVNPETCVIVQARGNCNRLADNDELKVLQSWAYEAGLAIGCYI